MFIAAIDSGNRRDQESRLVTGLGRPRRHGGQAVRDGAAAEMRRRAFRQWAGPPSHLHADMHGGHRGLGQQAQNDRDQQRPQQTRRCDGGEQSEDDHDPVRPTLHQTQRAGDDFAPEFQCVGKGERRRRCQGGRDGQGTHRGTSHGRPCALPVHRKQALAATMRGSAPAGRPSIAEDGLAGGGQWWRLERRSGLGWPVQLVEPPLQGGIAAIPRRRRRRLHTFPLPRWAAKPDMHMRGVPVPGADQMQPGPIP